MGLPSASLLLALLFLSFVFRFSNLLSHLFG
jgi:hypothetical protein